MYVKTSVAQDKYQLTSRVTLDGSKKIQQCIQSNENKLKTLYFVYTTSKMGIKMYLQRHKNTQRFEILKNLFLKGNNNKIFKMC